MKIAICILAVIFSSALIVTLRSKGETASRPAASIEKTRLKADEALRFCKSEEFNTDFCILVDMSLHSGVKRLFVWDFLNDTISYSFLVGHCCYDNLWSRDWSKDNPRFSNEDGSHCSSLGKYKIGERGYSDWGLHIKYLLHGLEKTNRNALARSIVFHSWDAVSDNEIYPDGTPEGWGCPVISNNSMKLIDPQLKSSQRPVLMWMYKE